MIAEGAANAVILAGTGQQCIDLFHRRLRAAEPKLEHPLHRRRQFLSPLQLPLDCGLVELLQGAAVLLQPCQQLRDLVDLGDGAAGELDEFGVDLRRGRLCNLASGFGFGEGAINTKPRLLMPKLVAQIACSAGESAWQPPVNLAFDLYVLPAVSAQPIEPLRVVEPVDLARVLDSAAAGAASTSGASAARRRRLCGSRARARPRPC